jgi:two-component system, response regulator
MAEQYVLLVEDDADDEELALRALAQAGLPRPVVVRDGQEALDYLFAENAYANRGGELPAAVLLDLKLPKLDGIMVLRRMRADRRTERTPVVVITSSTEAEDIAASYDAGATSYVHKPVDFAEFDAALADVVRYWTRLNLTPESR